MIQTWIPSYSGPFESGLNFQSESHGAFFPGDPRCAHAHWQSCLRSLTIRTMLCLDSSESFWEPWNEVSRMWMGNTQAFQKHSKHWIGQLPETEWNSAISKMKVTDRLVVRYRFLGASWKFGLQRSIRVLNTCTLANCRMALNFSETDLGYNRSNANDGDEIWHSSHSINYDMRMKSPIIIWNLSESIRLYLEFQERSISDISDQRQGILLAIFASDGVRNIVDDQANDLSIRISLCSNRSEINPLNANQDEGLRYDRSSTWCSKQKKSRY